MSTTVVHRLWNLWFGAAMFGTNFWLQFYIVVFFCFCNWYVILTWRVWNALIQNVKINWFYLCREREALFYTSLPLTSSTEDICQIHPRWTLSPQTWRLGRRSQLFAAVQSLSWQWGGDQPCFPFISRDESWCWYWYVVVFVVWGLADEALLGSKSCQAGGDGCEACLLYVSWGRGEGGRMSFHPGSLSLELPFPGASSAGICWHLGDHGRLIYHLCCCSLGWLQRLW